MFPQLSNSSYDTYKQSFIHIHNQREKFCNQLLDTHYPLNMLMPTYMQLRTHLPHIRDDYFSDNLYDNSDMLSPFFETHTHY